MGSSSNRKMSASHAEDPGAIPGGSTFTNSPVVQRRRHLSYKQETMVRFHPGLLQRRDAQIRQSAERSGLNPDVCRFESCSGYFRKDERGRQKDERDDESDSPFIFPPSSFHTRPRGAVWSARHPVTVEAVGSNPIGGAFELRIVDFGFRILLVDQSAIRDPKSEIEWHGTQTGKAAKLKPS